MQRELIFISAVLLGFDLSSANAVWFRGLDMPTPYSSRATALSPDGSVVMGEMWAPRIPNETFRWTLSGGLSRQADLAGWGGYGWPYAMSYDGSVVVGYDNNPAASPGHAFRWTADAGRVYLDNPTQVAQSEPWGISWDGATVVGYRVLTGETVPEAVRWQNGYAQPLGQAMFATGVSSTGSIVVGCTHTPGAARPFWWTPQAGIQFINLPDSTELASGPSISADGKTIVGNWIKEEWGCEAFIWTEQTGTVGLGDLPGGTFSSNVSGLSADGRIIVGLSVTGSHSPGGGLILESTAAFIWDQNYGMRSLPAVLTEEYGLDLQGWELWEATGISADGRTIAGNGISPDGYWRPWVAQIPEPSSGLLLLLFAWFGCPLTRRHGYSLLPFPIPVVRFSVPKCPFRS